MITQTKLLIEEQLNASVEIKKMGQLYGSSKNLAIAEILDPDAPSVMCVSQLRFSSICSERYPFFF